MNKNNDEFDDDFNDDLDNEFDPAFDDEFYDDTLDEAFDTESLDSEVSEDYSNDLEDLDELDDLDENADQPQSDMIKDGISSKKLPLSFNTIIIIGAVILGAAVLYFQVFSKSSPSSSGERFASALNMQGSTEGPILGQDSESSAAETGENQEANEDAQTGFLFDPESLNEIENNNISNNSENEEVSSERIENFELSILENESANQTGEEDYIELSLEDADETSLNAQADNQTAEEIRQEAFDAAITGLFPMRPDEIREVLRQYDTTTRAVEEPINGVPTPKIVVETISLDPGAQPLMIKTATGYITTLNILDTTGAPWPIQDIGWAGDFEIVEPEEGGHIIRITPMSLTAHGNMSIRLVELKTPVTIMLSTSKDEVQYRVDARVGEFGPQSAPQIIEGGSDIVAGGDTIMSMLDGTPPNSAERLSVSGVDGRTSAFKYNNMTYVRTPLTLLSPGWQQSVSSADGMNVYALNDAPVLLLSDRGNFIRANLNSENKDPFNER